MKSNLNYLFKTVAYTMVVLFSFSARAQTPAAVSGIFSISGPSTTPTFHWHSYPGALSYELQISRDINFGITILSDTMLVDSTFTSGFLWPWRGYYCRVRPFTTGGPAEWYTTVPFYADERNVFTFCTKAGWNFISIPFDISDSVRNFLFPSPCSSPIAYCYNNSYNCCGDFRQYERFGFWKKYSDAVTIGVTGLPLVSDTESIRSGWNIVGSLSRPVAAASLLTDPPGLVDSRFFFFSPTGYLPTDTIEPFRACWVKSKGSGKLMFSLPPQPPGHIVAHVYWGDSGIAGKRIVIVETQDTLFTGPDGQAEFTLPSGRYTLRAFGINGPGPEFIFREFDVVAFPGETIRVEILDCLPCS